METMNPIDSWIANGPSTEDIQKELGWLEQQALWNMDRQQLLRAALRARRLSEAKPENGPPPVSASPLPPPAPLPEPPTAEEEGGKPDCYLNMEVFDDTCPTQCVGYKGCSAKQKREAKK